MPQRFNNFSTEQLQTIHKASLEILEETGVEFPGKAGLEVFRKNGFRTDGEKVFITEKQLEKALATAPLSFRLRARNPENDLNLGGGDFVLAPTGGAPHIMDLSGELRECSLEDYRDFAKLVQTSPINMIMTHRVCFPADVHPDLAYLDMFIADVTLTDRVLMCSAVSKDQADDSLKILDIIFGGRDEVTKSPCSLNVVNVCSPLKYAPDQTEVLMLLAENNQPVAVTNMMMLGATGPLSIAGALALGNAEILAGIVLSQLVRPGAPVIYGSTSCPMDMKSMVATLGAPETMWLSKGALALADYYNLPCRTGGSLTDSFLPDAQAFLDGGLIFQNALYGGANFIFHSFGMVGSYLAASFEKFVIDEEMANIALAALKVPEVDEKTLELKLIKQLGSKSDYLTQPSTVKNFRKLFRSKFLNRSPYEQWADHGGRTTAALAEAEVKRRLSAWEKPPIDPALEKEFLHFIDSRRKKAAG